MGVEAENRKSQQSFNDLKEKDLEEVIEKGMLTKFLSNSITITQGFRTTCQLRDKVTVNKIISLKCPFF